MRWKKKLCGIYYIKIMETYCVCCKKNTANKKSVRKAKQNRFTLLSFCAVCGKKNRLSLKSKTPVSSIQQF